MENKEEIKSLENKEEVKQRSRKWFLVLLVITLASVGAFVPPVVSILLKAVKPLIILSGTEWVSVITMVTAAYIGGNVWQKHIQKTEGKSE